MTLIRPLEFGSDLLPDHVQSAVDGLRQHRIRSFFQPATLEEFVGVLNSNARQAGDGRSRHRSFKFYASQTQRFGILLVECPSSVYEGHRVLCSVSKYMMSYFARHGFLDLLDSAEAYPISGIRWLGRSLAPHFGANLDVRFVPVRDEDYVNFGSKYGYRMKFLRVMSLDVDGRLLGPRYVFGKSLKDRRFEEPDFPRLERMLARIPKNQLLPYSEQKEWPAVLVL